MSPASAAVLAVLVLFIFGWALSSFALFLSRPPRPIKLNHFKRLANGDYIMDLEWKGEFFSVRGSCTVWRYYPSGARCSTSTESKLSDIWTKLEWERGGEA